MMNSLTIFISHATQVIVNYFCQRTKTSHFTFFDLTTYIYIYIYICVYMYMYMCIYIYIYICVAQLNLIILPGGGHGSSQGN